MDPTREAPLKFWIFREPRRGVSIDDCQDAAAGDPFLGRFAIADGASESFSPALWADLLVRSFVDTKGPVFWDYRLSMVQDAWCIRVHTNEDSENLPYYLEDRFRQGAFSTFLGLNIDISDDVDQPSPEYYEPPFSWQASAVGDSCLFKVRKGKLIEKFPIVQSSTFKKAPRLLNSRNPEKVTEEQRLSLDGTLDVGEQLWLMTDALAHWFLREHEQDKRPWEELASIFEMLPPSASFSKWVREQRDAHRLKDDDVTLVIVYPDS